MYAPQDMHAYMNWTDTQPEKHQSPKRWLREKDEQTTRMQGSNCTIRALGRCRGKGSLLLRQQPDATLSTASSLKVQLKWLLFCAALHNSNNFLSAWLNFIGNTFIIAQYIYCAGVVYIVFVFPLAWIRQEQGLVYSKY